ncbi:MAG: hypothetical protein IT379_02315 [Deltaproteobacteria bacterium]|nr:hypothetical protein [Deltaproteobacteria bacterium]
MASKNQNAHTLTLGDVKRLGAALLDIADRYPTGFVTEIDFYPLVIAFLSWKLAGLKAEARGGEGTEAVDFKVTRTTNPAYLELAVAPRVLGDLEADVPKAFPNKTQLYATQNASELNKLSSLGGATKGRFLLLLDLRKKPHDVQDLRNKYEAAAKEMSGSNGVRVVYIHRDKQSCADFLIKNPAKK